MLTKEFFTQSALRLFEFCDYPAVRYKILFHFLDRPYEDEELTALRPAFLYSDIVDELFREQDIYGGWGKLLSKDYSAKDKFPTSSTAINRCLYIGLTIEDRDILLRAYDYLEDFLTGKSKEKFRPSNERVIPWNEAVFCNLIESVKPYNPLCDRTFDEWNYIVQRAFEDGEYSYEREKAAQHEIFWTKEDRLVPMQTELLLKRRENITPQLEQAMLLHYGGHASKHGHFWQQSVYQLPENFVYNKTRRWFYTFNYVNQFRNSQVFLKNAVNWLIQNQNKDGLWDWGSQTKDPWGYFGYFSTAKSNVFNRTVDCTVEILSFLKKYMDNNINTY